MQQDLSMKYIYKASVSKIEIVAQGVKKITFQMSEPFSFLPWQYVWVEILQMKVSDPKGNRRAFSILNTVHDANTIEIVARISESGYKQSFFALHIGDEVKIHGPFGSTFIVDDTHKPGTIVMIAGGVGIAAFLPIIETIRNKKYPIKCFLIYVNKSPETTPFLSELETIKNNGTFFNFKVTYEHFLWKDVTDLPIETNGEIKWWVTGPQGMVDQVFSELEFGGISKADMQFENFYPKRKNNLTTELISIQSSETNIFAKGIVNSTNHTIITDAEGIILFANKAAEKTTGYSVDEMISNTPRLWGGLMSHEFYVDFWRKKYSGEPFAGEITNRRKNGELYTVIAHISPILDQEKQVIGFIATEEDITHLKRLESEAIEKKVRDEAILSSVGDGLVALDALGNVIFMNEATKNLIGWSKEELVGKSWLDTIPLLDENNVPVEMQKRPFMLALQNGEKISSKYHYMKKNKTIFPVAITVSPIVLSGKNIGAIQVFRDITRDEEVDREKTEFISLASHQLRTPLTAINWSCETLLSGDLGEFSAQQKEHIEEVYEGSQRMVKLVNALLNVSRIETGTFLVEPETVDILKIVQAVLDESKKKIEDKKLVVHVENDNIPSILLDPNLTTIIFQNLLTNSIKYTPAGGIITILLRVCAKGVTITDAMIGEDSLLIQVNDNGIGIPQAHQKDMFTKLFRADNARAADQDGSGLGLYLVKSLIEHAGGKIWFTSEEGKGTTFFVLIPLSGMIKKEGTKALSQ